MADVWELCDCGDSYYDPDEYSRCYSCFKDDHREADWAHCGCGRGRYNANLYGSCYECFIERRADYVDCILCGWRWHSPEFATCYACRGERDDAARDLRLLILHRDGYVCRICGSSRDLQVDHLRPCSAGGTADPWNLQALCGPCNRDKGNEWWPGCRWDRMRHEQIRAYFFEWRCILDDEQADHLRNEVAHWRLQNEYDPRLRWRTDWSERAAQLLDEMEADLEARGPLSRLAGEP